MRFRQAQQSQAVRDRAIGRSCLLQDCCDSERFSTSQPVESLKTHNLAVLSKSSKQAAKAARRGRVRVGGVPAGCLQSWPPS